jgi:hypothetical protein
VEDDLLMVTAQKQTAATKSDELLAAVERFARVR